ncbi:MAG: protein kinase [Myxococcota bacterium]
MTTADSTIRCPSCGQENRQGRRFCAQCGVRFHPVCGSCGARNEAGERFCGECGTPLEARGAAATASSAAPVSGVADEGSGPPSASGSSPAAPSSVSAGRYELLRFLGEGAKKRVFLARDTKLDRQVAIALVKTDGLDASGLARVRREAEAMGKLGDHQNVVTVFDVEEEDDCVFIVSRYVGGGDVEKQLLDATDHRMPSERALVIAIDVARALDHAHHRGVVHRDVKPGNIWLAEDGHALLGDFGLASLEGRERLTQEGTMLGTVAYMPPEQALGRKADHRSDLYALGATLYEILAGCPPFRGEDMVGVVAQHINSPPVRPSWHEKSVSRELDALVLRLLAKDPDERPQSASEVVASLEELARQEATRTGSTHDSRSQETLPPATLGLFVGRDRESTQLQGIFTRTLSGEGFVAMIVGEPGIGKTRFSVEFTVHAKLRGAQVFTGPCYEGEASVSYLPFIEALREYVRATDDDELLRSELGRGAPELAIMLPDIRERLPDLPEAAPLEGDAERQRLFDSMTTFLRRASARAPLVLILDDLHWADKPTLLLLLHLARRIRRDRILLLGTYRETELERTHPLTETMATLRSDGLYERILLRGLSLDGVRALLEARSGHEVPPRFVERILEETEGNPFFVEEVVKHLIETEVIRREGGTWVGDFSVIERSIPEGVREVIGHRLTRLSEPCNAMLTVGAAMSGGFDFQILRAVLEGDDDALLDQLDEALRAQVIRERRDGGRTLYEFSHALIRQTLYQELSTPRRVRLHRLIGEAMERLYGLAAGPHLAEIAHHCFQGAPGGDVDKAVATSKRAAEQARQSLAWEDAAGHAARALEAFEMKAVGDEAQLFDLIFSVGDLQRLAGERNQSRQTLSRAIDVARRTGDSERLGRAVLSYAGEDVTVQFDSPDVIEVLEDALTRLAPADSAQRSRLLSRLAVGLIFSRVPERASKLAGEAVEMARRLDDPATLCRALIIDGIVSLDQGSLERNIALGREQRELALRAGSSELVVNASFRNIFNTLHLGDGDQFDAAVEEYGQLAENLRQPSLAWFAASHRALLAILRGPMDEAARLIEEAREAGERGENPLAPFFYEAQRSLVDLECGSEQAANERLLDMWATPIGKAAHQGASMGTTLIRMGRIEAAREIFEATASRHFDDIHRDGNWHGRIFVTAQTCLELGDRERAAELYDLLLPSADFAATAGPISIYYGPVTQILARLAALCGRRDECVQHFGASIEKTQRLRFPVQLASFRLEYATALFDFGGPGDRERALELSTQALLGAEGLGMKTCVERALALKLRIQGAETSGVKRSVYVVAEAVESRRPDLAPHAAPDGTVTLMFSDMQGFTAMTERLGDLKARDVIRDHNSIVRKNLAVHGGYEVELRGDGFLLAFQSARQALLCAIAMQQAFARYSEENVDEPIRIRIGIHTGEALRDADKFFGKTVILAARIAAQANGGQILVSSLLKQLTESVGDVRFGATREICLKGISEPQQVVDVRWE